jgi:hypothetical protein
MIAKGTTHNNGARLASYMTTGKEGERAELWQLSGFAADDIKEAFRSVHVMAEATRCEQPFFHVQVRNPEFEELSRERWLCVADRIESKLGLTDQPRAIAFHVDLTTGHEHMHVAWTRIDAATLTARPLPFFKERLKEVCRELETSLDLTRVRNEREGPIMAPTRNEFEQARRLGVDIHKVRQTIRDCYERSDTGRSFEAALSEHGLVLAQGDRRAFLIIDHEGGTHALGKRILGVTAGQVRGRLADLDRESLPTVEQARSFIRERQGGRERDAAEAMPDANRRELDWQDALADAAIERAKREQTGGREKHGVHGLGDSDRYEIVWQDALAKAAIEKEKIEGRFAEQPRPNAPRPERELTETAANIRLARSFSTEPQIFVDALAERGVWLAVATEEEAARSALERQALDERNQGAKIWQQHGNREYLTPTAPVYAKGEFVALDTLGNVYRLNQQTTGHEPTEMQAFLRTLDVSKFKGIDATREEFLPERRERQAKPEDTRGVQGEARPAAAPDKSPISITAPLGRMAFETGAELAAAGIEMLANMFSAPSLPTAEQFQARQEAQERKQDAIEFDARRYIEDRSYRARCDEQERLSREQEAQARYLQRQQERDR